MHNSMHSNYIHFIKNFDIFNRDNPLLVCLHGNSSCAETFSTIMNQIDNKIQLIAIDLPGCGKSLRLQNYTMHSVGKIISEFIASFNPSLLYIFGHSLGGHLIAFLTNKIDGIILSGTPPLSGMSDFSSAFTPCPSALELLPLLSQQSPFSESEAHKFISHTGVTGDLLELMINNAMLADGNFRKGCLSTLADIDQRKIIESSRNVVIFHARQDGVINPDYLETINKECLFQNKIHYLDGKHMTPIFNASEIISIIESLIL